MDKVLVLRGRVGGDKRFHHRNRSKIRQQLHEGKYEDIPLKESIKPKITWDDLKELNEYLNPLYRFLEKSIGRSWNDIYSEIRTNINPNSAVQYHILQHLDWAVEKHVQYDIDNTPMAIAYGGLWELRNNEFYVCPESGILKKHQKKRNIKKEKEIVKHNLFDSIDNKKENEFLEKIDGIWYHVKYEWVKRTAYSKIKGIHTYTTLEISYKHQLSKKELKRFELLNDNSNFEQAA